MNQIIEAMSDRDLLGMIVGSKTAAKLLRDAGGSLSKLLNECSATYDPQPKVTTKLKVAKELVRRSLVEVLRERDVLSSPARCLISNRVSRLSSFKKIASDFELGDRMTGQRRVVRRLM